MNFRDAQLASALIGWRQIGDVEERSAADNIHFEERVSAARQQKFEGEAAGSANVASLRRAHIDYWKTFVEVDDGIPDTFEASLTPAGLGTLDGSQKIVRIESLVRPLEKHGITFEQLKKSYDNNEAAVVEGFLRLWNQSNVRDSRPAFAAFKDEVRDDLARADWPSRLRDRLGLAHYDCAAGPIPIALMEYSVAEVITLAAGKGVASWPVAVFLSGATTIALRSHDGSLRSRGR